MNRAGSLLMPVLRWRILFYRCQAQERPYFVTYSHEMEEPGNLEIEMFNAVGKPPKANRFLGANLEFEYGVKAWWTSEFYLDGQATIQR